MLVSTSIIGYRAFYRPTVTQLYTQATAAANGTTTAKITASETAQAQATTLALQGYQHLYNQITSRPSAFHDNLQHPDRNNWDIDSGCAFQHGTYRVTLHQKGYFLPCFARKATFANFAYQAHMTIIKGDVGGLAFRGNPRTSQSYLFTIGRDGSYSVYYYPGDTHKTVQALLNGYSDFITTGIRKENILTVIVQNHTIHLYINKAYIASLNNQHLTRGKIGVIASEVNATTEVSYSHIQVWKL
jgi:hypothetical protein